MEFSREGNHMIRCVITEEEIEVNEDGLMEVGEININKIAQEEGTRIIFDSGNAFEE